MKPTKATLFFHPVFLLCLFLLLWNDLYLKSEYHNWLTGKLSDFAGTIVLPVALCVFFPVRQRTAVLVTGLFFCWWKSVFSQPAIDLLHNWFSLPVDRTVDETDLLALGLLPVVSLLKPVQLRFTPLLQKLLSFLVAGVTVLTLCSTTGPYRYIHYEGFRENTVSFYENYTSRKTSEEIIAGLQRRGLQVIERQTRDYPHLNAEQLYYRVSPNHDSIAEWIPVPQSKDSVIYLKRPTQPYYVIPFYVLNGDTLRNIEFTIYSQDRKKKKSSIWVEQFETTQPDKYKQFYGRQRKSYKKHFEMLFSEP